MSINQLYLVLKIAFISIFYIQGMWRHIVWIWKPLSVFFSFFLNKIATLKLKPKNLVWFYTSSYWAFDEIFKMFQALYALIESISTYISVSTFQIRSHIDILKCLNITQVNHRQCPAITFSLIASWFAIKFTLILEHITQIIHMN